MSTILIETTNSNKYRIQVAGSKAIGQDLLELSGMPPVSLPPEK